jgi:hypothetical protein
MHIRYRYAARTHRPVAATPNGVRPPTRHAGECELDAVA